MAIDRYRNTRIITNNAPEYHDILNKRDVPYIVHFSFDKFKELKMKDVPTLVYSEHIWTSSDRFFKLAAEYYGDPLYWWVIAYYNGTPLETDVSVGDTLYIPYPLEELLSAMEI